MHDRAPPSVTLAVRASSRRQYRRLRSIRAINRGAMETPARGVCPVCIIVLPMGPRDGSSPMLILAHFPIFCLVVLEGVHLVIELIQRILPFVEQAVELVHHRVECHLLLAALFFLLVVRSIDSIVDFYAGQVLLVVYCFRFCGFC